MANSPFSPTSQESELQKPWELGILMGGLAEEVGRELSWKDGQESNMEEVQEDGVEYLYP